MCSFHLLFEATDVLSSVKQAQELAAAASKFAECQKTIASLGQKLKSLASLEDFLVDSDTIPGLTDEEDLQHPESGYGPCKPDPSYLTSEKRESDYSRDNFSTPSQKARERGGTNPSDNRSVSWEKSRRGPGKLPSRGNRTGS